MIKFKEFNVGDADYKEQMEQFQTEHQNAEFVQITGGHMGYEKIWFKYDDNINQPQLTIPKSIAESNWMKHLLSCDLSQFEFERFDEFLNKEDEQFLKWVNTGKNENILYIYLAGKALGVDLVKVVEG